MAVALVHWNPRGGETSGRQALPRVAEVQRCGGGRLARHRRIGVDVGAVSSARSQKMCVCVVCAQAPVFVEARASPAPQRAHALPPILRWRRSGGWAGAPSKLWRRFAPRLCARGSPPSRRDPPTTLQRRWQRCGAAADAASSCHLKRRRPPRRLRASGKSLAAARPVHRRCLMGPGPLLSARGPALGAPDSVALGPSLVAVVEAPRGATAQAPMAMKDRQLGCCSAPRDGLAVAVLGPYCWATPTSWLLRRWRRRMVALRIWRIRVRNWALRTKRIGRRSLRAVARAQGRRPAGAAACWDIAR